MPTPPHPDPTQGQRRVKYGLNVAVAILAAVGIAVLINWIGFRQFVRFDLTSTRRYSLSPQTRHLLADLTEPYHLVTLFSGTGPYTDQARDLVDEYSRYSSHLTVEHIDPATQPTRVEAFYASLRQRYDEQLTPLAGAIDRGRQALTSLLESSDQLRLTLDRVLDDPGLNDRELKTFLQSLAQAFSRIGSNLTEQDRQLQQSLDTPLPDYAQASRTLQAWFDQLDQGVYSFAIDQLSKAADTDTLPGSVRDGLLQLVSRLRQQRDQLRDAATELRDAKPVPDYDQVVNQLTTPETIVAVGPRRVRVLSLAELFQPPQDQQLQSEDDLKFQFLGEEKITGALLSLSLPNPPMVVFVCNPTVEAEGPNGQFEQVVQRLRNLNFQVQQWNPAGSPTMMDASHSPENPPQPQPGQKAVWVLLPQAPTNPMMPTADPTDAQVVDMLRSRAAAGDGVLLMLQASSMTRFGAPSPWVDWLKDWDINPQLDRIVLREIPLDEHKTQSINLIAVAHWPAESPITQALASTPGLFAKASPLVIGTGQASIKTWPLATLQGNDLWAERDFEAPEPPQRDPSSPGGPFVVAAAAERDNQRIVVVADPFWATDQITSWIKPVQGRGDLFEYRFPANAELFVNSVQWLARLDQLIAASARTQDIRRVQPMTLAQFTTLRWTLLLGMPAAVAAAGLGVWLVRRRG